MGQNDTAGDVGDGICRSEPGSADHAVPGRGKRGLGTHVGHAGWQARGVLAGSNTTNVREILNSEIQSVSYSYTPSENEVVVTNQLSQVELNADGAVTGRVFPLRWEDQGQSYDLTGNQVYLLDNSGVIANSPVNADGSYSLPDVAPGVYDFVSFGPHGAAALSIEVLGDNSVANNNVDASFASASTNSGVLNGFDIVLSEPVVGVATTPAVTVDVEVPLPQGGGGFGGGYGGGGYGGGGGGFGDFGGIISAALGAWVLAEAFKNNNNNAQVIQPPVVLPPPVIPPPTSPF